MRKCNFAIFCDKSHSNAIYAINCNFRLIQTAIFLAIMIIVKKITKNEIFHGKIAFYPDFLHIKREKIVIISCTSRCLFAIFIYKYMQKM